MKPDSDPRSLPHDAEVRPSELLAQNEALRLAHAQAATALARYTDHFDFAPIGYFNLTADGTIRLANLTGARLLGTERAQVLGRRFDAFLTGSDRPLVAAFIARVFATGEKQTCQIALEHPGRPALTGDLEGTLSPDGLECRAVLIDSTERRQAAERTQHLSAFPELNPNPVLEFDADGTLVYHNPAALKMAHKVGFAELAQLLPAAAHSIVAECLASGLPQLRMETVHGKNTLSWSFYPITGLRVVHCYVGDITERLSLEGQLRQAQKMDAIGQLAGGVAHDFNNLLTAIIGHLGLLRGNPQVTPEIAESLAEISGAANRAANLTSQLLAFGRRHVISATALDLNEVVSNLTKLLRRLLGEDIGMEVDYAPEQITFLGDAGLIEQVLVNLAVNARDAMPQGGTLRIATRCEPLAPSAKEGTEPAEVIRLSVSDTGTGIPPEIRSKIFEPFFTTKDVGKGTGLGLATVFGIVQQHQGWIEVESEVGEGTTFHLYLPRLAGAPMPAPFERPSPPARGRDEGVLLVEDEPAVRDIAKQVLSRQGYRVLTAADGHEALAVWAQHQAGISLLLTDMKMPDGISGAQLARQLLREKPSLKIVYTSGYGAGIGGDDLTLTDGLNYLAKPYEFDHLCRTVRTALDGAPAP